jgi:hypothetical protein
MVLDDILVRTPSSLSQINPPQGLPQRLEKDFAWGKRGPATKDAGLYQNRADTLMASYHGQDVHFPYGKTHWHLGPRCSVLTKGTDPRRLGERDKVQA